MEHMVPHARLWGVPGHPGANPVCADCLTPDDQPERWGTDDEEWFDPLHCVRCRRFLQNPINEESARTLLEQWERHKDHPPLAPAPEGVVQVLHLARAPPPSKP